MRAAFKLLSAILHLLHGYWIIKTQFSRISQEKREQHVRVWSSQLIAKLGLQLHVSGVPVKHGMIVANHISWLDILAIHAAHFCRFIAKSDIKAWPVIGYLTAGSGTLFVERSSRRDAHRVVDTVAKRLLEGDCVALFPEGTTGEGRELLPFHANMIQSAIDAGAVIQPVSIQFIDTIKGTQSFAPCYVGDESLLQSVWRTLNAKGIVVKLQFGEPQSANYRDRRAWAKDLHATIHTMLT